jgi:hypothetical protein
MINNLFLILLILIFIIIFCYIFGIILINTINDKLKNINIDIKYPIENFNNKTEIEDNKKEIVISNTYNTETGKKINDNKTNFDNEYYQQMNENNKVEGFINDPPNSFKIWNIEKKKTQTCIKNHKHTKDGKDLNCTYGVTNYADPKDISQIDYKIFYLNYPPNMTLQDYINWLYCYIDREEELPYNHLKNLEKIKIGKELIQEEGVLPPPGYHYPPLNSEDYFNKMYNSKQEFNTAFPLNSNTASLIGYNYDDYSEFSQNTNVYGTSGQLRNPDIGLKKNAKKLFDYINPKDSNSLNIDKEYQIYRMKNVEI